MKLMRKNLEDLIPYEPGKPIEEVKREYGLKEVIKMASNENCLGPSPLAVEALRKALSNIHLYPDGGGFSLRRKIAQRLGLKMENIILGNGSDEIIRMIVETFLNPGEETIMGDPAFIIYEMATKVMNGNCIKVPLKNYAHDLYAMREKITPRTKLFFVSNPNNPTGTMVRRKEVDEIMKDFPEHTIAVFDEAYYEYIEEEDFPDTLYWLKRGKNIIILRTFSKIYGLAGLRIGYAISSPQIISALNRVRQPFNTNSLAQTAALAALDDEEHVRRSRELNRKGKEYFYREFRRMGLEFIPTATNFILVNVKRDGREVFEKLLRKGIIVRPMSGYGLSTFIRVTIGREEENQKFISSLKEVMEEIENG